MGYAKDSASRGPRFEPCGNVFCLFFVFCFCFLLFFSFAFFGLKFDACCFFFFSYGHSKQTRSLLPLDLYYSAWRHSVTLIMGFIHGQRIVFTLRTAEVKVSFWPIH